MNALIVAANKQISASLSSAIRRAGAENIVAAFDAVSAKRLSCDRAFDVTVVYAENAAGQSLELARIFAARGGGVILIAAAGDCDEVARRLEDDGVLVLGKPLSHTELYRAVALVRATNNRIARLVEEKRDLLKKIDDLRLINRAKIILMQNMGFTEEQAHRHIEKRAMDQRRTRAEVAMEILRTYEV
ncbi:MAG: ANTAR domain-containing protein [Clostridiales bacterium]|nr:ANTAR domain-containing protein [Clostridiales bacterium]